MSFEHHYGIEEDEVVKDFHASRRMWVIKQDSLVLAQEGTSDSHAAWFSREGWMSEDDPSFIDEVVRGYVSVQGDVHYYVGFDFRDEGLERVLRALPELTRCVPRALRGRLLGGARSDLSFAPRSVHGSVAAALP